MIPFIRTTKEKGFAKLYFQTKVDGRQVRFCLGDTMQVNIEDFKKCIVDTKGKEVTVKGVRKVVNVDIYSDTKINNLMKKLDFKSNLDKISNAIDSKRMAGTLTVDAVKELIDTVTLAEVRQEEDRNREREKKRKEEEEAKQKAIEEAKRKDVKGFIQGFLSAITNGDTSEYDIKYTDRKPNTVKTWKQSMRVFLEYFNHHNVDSWDDIDIRYTMAYFSYLNKHFMKSTAHRYFKELRSMMQIACDNNRRTMAITSDMFKVEMAKPAEVTKKIYLTLEELHALADFPLSGLQDDVRDLFLMGCYTGQRFSDYSRISPDSIVDIDGVTNIKLTQRKTGNDVMIPVLDDNMKSLLEKYHYAAPQVVDQVLNRYIKEIGKKMAETTCPSLNALVPTVLTKKEIAAEEAGKISFQRDSQGRVLKHRFELIASHTARRTAATLMYLSGKYTVQDICRVTGHRTVVSLMRYLVEGIEEDALVITTKAGCSGLFGKAE